MKNLIALFLFVSLIACKKKEEPSPTPTPPPCTTQSMVFKGIYRINTGNHDIINIAFDKNYCPDNNKNLYWCYGLNKAIQPLVTTHTLNLNYNYAITSTESVKTGSLNGYYGAVIRVENDSTIYIAMPNEGDFYFTKIQ